MVNEVDGEMEIEKKLFEKAVISSYYKLVKEKRNIIVCLSFINNFNKRTKKYCYF